MNVPNDLRFTKSHEWVRVDGNTVTIGITDHAQSELGDIVFVDLPTAGRTLAAGDTFASVESVKTVADVYTPIAGTVEEANEALGSQAELVNADPYNAGWLVKLKVDDLSTLDSLMDADAYRKAIE
ncbi:MAG: glycine cleavage system protein GcvH [Fimbriimonadaceae bacterium]